MTAHIGGLPVEELIPAAAAGIGFLVRALRSGGWTRRRIDPAG